MSTQNGPPEARPTRGLGDRPILAAILSAVLAALAAVLGVTVVPPRVQPPVIIQPDPPPPPPPAPKPEPSKPEPPKTDPLNAIVRIAAGNVGCSATVIGPRRPDGRWWVLTAAHCVSGNGQTWRMHFRGGRVAAATVVNHNKRADFAWMLTESNTDNFPFTYLAESTPPPGTPIWHAGFGVHIPANREDGIINGVPNADGQVEMKLSVSSGDSGGGIAMTADGHVVSTVCCTTNRGGVGQVWGATTEAIRRGQVAATNLDEWHPLEIPLRMPDEK